MSITYAFPPDTTVIASPDEDVARDRAAPGGAALTPTAEDMQRAKAAAAHSMPLTRRTFLRLSAKTANSTQTAAQRIAQSVPPRGRSMSERSDRYDERRCAAPHAAEHRAAGRYDRIGEGLRINVISAVTSMTLTIGENSRVVRGDRTAREPK